MSTGSSRRLSPWRVSLALVILISFGYATSLNFDRFRVKEVIDPPKLPDPWFAAYVDVTSTPPYPFEQLGATSTQDVVLSFIVASPKDACVPTWGGYYTLEEASVALDLDRRIARLDQQGGKVAVSFGGLLNAELSLACKDEEGLFKAYQSVIDRYGLDTIDLDIESESIKDRESLDRRGRIMKRLQDHFRNTGKNLAVWLTLPVAPQGLTQEGADVVSIMLTSGVDLAGVNVMTMDYGASRAAGQSMFEVSKSALVETHRQLGILYNQAGIYLGNDSLWRKIGATPMIGQNDVIDEVFTLEEATAFNAFAQEKKIGRMSMWSANRDAPCGDNYVDTRVVSNSCSGTKDSKMAYGQELSTGFEGDMTQNAGILTNSDPKPIVTLDDPENSPYQVWKETGAYPKGVKVVWHGNVYEAKWWTKNELPDNPVLQSWETPWQLVGPVLPGEKPVRQPTLPEKTYPRWSGKVVYEAGDRVLFDGIPFQAKWWNEGESPAASSANPDSSPWTPLTHAQIVEILNDLGQ
ncbi:MAG: chitinase [Candidatus Moraniibacteriota bacterium]